MQADTTTTIVFDGEPYQLVEKDKLNATELAAALGYSIRTVVSMKSAGCPFFGRYSSVQIVRKWEFYNPGWRARNCT